MKKQIILTLITLFLLQSCSKKESDEKELLPPSTQTGAGTFACHVNGKAFIDKSGGWFNCFYQYVDGEYTFSIKGKVDENKGNINIPWAIGLGSQDITLSENTTITIGKTKMDSPYASAGATFSRSRFDFINSKTDDIQYKGEFTITKMDFTNYIVSGTFWFDVKNPYTGKTVKIRNGRFDTKFTM